MKILYRETRRQYHKVLEFCSATDVVASSDVQRMAHDGEFVVKLQIENI